MSPLTVAVGPSPLGSGVFATRAFQPGQPILVVSGPILDEAGVVALGADAVYALQTARNEYVDLSSPGRFLNHSCDPNAGVVRDRVLIALRSIAPGRGDPVRLLDRDGRRPVELAAVAAASPSAAASSSPFSTSRPSCRIATCSSGSCSASSGTRSAAGPPPAGSFRFRQAFPQVSF